MESDTKSTQFLFETAYPCVEIQAQHRPSRLKKPRTESVRYRSVRPRTESVGTDRIRRFCAENRMTR